MGAKRIVKLCEHGVLSHGEYGRELTGCDGGRVLTEGQYVLIEKVDGEWPEWLRREASYVIGYLTDDHTHALSDHTEGTP